LSPHSSVGRALPW